MTSQQSELADFLGDELWCPKDAFLADLLQSLNILNKSMQRDGKNILTCTDKINDFKEKRVLWEERIRKEKAAETMD